MTPSPHARDYTFHCWEDEHAAHVSLALTRDLKLSARPNVKRHHTDTHKQPSLTQ